MYSSIPISNILNGETSRTPWSPFRSGSKTLKLFTLPRIFFSRGASDFVAYCTQLL